MNFAHLKARCAGCEKFGVEMNKEHLFPKWLILRTGTNATGIRWGSKRQVPALSCTVPLCIECNSDFGTELEGPAERLFTQIEAGDGISDEDAELLVRWLWKIKGLDWIANHPHGRYSHKYTLRERVLLPIDAVREHLILAGALIGQVDPEFGDSSIGVDATTEHDAIFVSGVFSRIAIMVLRSEFQYLVPSQFDLYHLAPKRATCNAGRLFYPRVSFRDDTEAVVVTKLASEHLSKAHDDLAISIRNQISQ
jgi:hypothetical protein